MKCLSNCFSPVRYSITGHRARHSKGIATVGCVCLLVLAEPCGSLGLNGSRGASGTWVGRARLPSSGGLWESMGEGQACQLLASRYLYQGRECAKMAPNWASLHRESPLRLLCLWQMLEDLQINLSRIWCRRFPSCCFSAGSWGE